MVVSPDVGGVARANTFAKMLPSASLAIVYKRRHGDNVVEVDLAKNMENELILF